MNNELPLVSIIVPVYNVSQYLEKCILSIINQSIKNIEVILVDDGSTDNSGVICNKFAEMDSRIKVIHKQNCGLVTARKAGLRVASGKYIGFVDGDDYVALDMFEKLCDNLEKTQADFVYSGIIINGNTCDCLANDVIRIDDIEKNVDEYFLDIDSSKRMGATLCTKLFCSNIIKDAYEIVPDGQALGEDSIATLECIFRCKKISLLNQAYYYYSVREDSITHVQNINKVVQETSLYNCMRSILERYSCSSHTFYLLEKRYLFRLWGKLSERMKQDIPMIKYIYPNPIMLCGKKIVVYGAGTVGQGYYAQISSFNNCKVVAWIDKNYDKYNFAFRKVEDVQRLLSLEFDLIVIAVQNKETAKIIRQSLVDAGIDENKIIWEAPSFILK